MHTICHHVCKNILKGKRVYFHLHIISLKEYIHTKITDNLAASMEGNWMGDTSGGQSIFLL